MKSLPKIVGFNINSEMEDFLFCPTVFLEGCNLRCPYCMNADIINKRIDENKIQEVISYLSKEKPEWIIISGGEPTLYVNDGSLSNLISEFEKMNCKIVVCTNGTNPEAIKYLVTIEMIDYVALDIKTGGLGYVDAGDSYKIWDILGTKSILTMERAKNNKFNYEIRTTLYPPFINMDTIKEIGQIIRKDEKWVLQQFRKNKVMLDDKAQDIEPYDLNFVRKLVEEAKKYSDNVVLRFV
jgi:pyruvate formate lyase activating enzyme